MGGNDFTSENYQEKYQSFHKTRTWWMDQLIEYPTDKEIQLQRYIQSLHQELQVSHQTKLSLQEALVETNKQGIVYVHFVMQCVYIPTLVEFDWRL